MSGSVAGVEAACGWSEESILLTGHRKAVAGRDVAATDARRRALAANEPDGDRPTVWQWFAAAADGGVPRAQELGRRTGPQDDGVPVVELAIGGFRRRRPVPLVDIASNAAGDRVCAV